MPVNTYYNHKLKTFQWILRFLRLLILTPPTFLFLLSSLSFDPFRNLRSSLLYSLADALWPCSLSFGYHLSVPFLPSHNSVFSDIFLFLPPCAICLFYERRTRRRRRFFLHLCLFCWHIWLPINCLLVFRYHLLVLFDGFSCKNSFFYQYIESSWTYQFLSYSLS